jgi:hypothetical protein
MRTTIPFAADQRERRSGLSCERGSVMVEYAVLLSAVAVGCAFALAALGAPLYRLYLDHQTWLMLPGP